jgi:hypothetical protein
MGIFNYAYRGAFDGGGDCPSLIVLDGGRSVGEGLRDIDGRNAERDAAVAFAELVPTKTGRAYARNASVTGRTRTGGYNPPRPGTGQGLLRATARRPLCPMWGVQAGPIGHGPASAPLREVFTGGGKNSCHGMAVIFSRPRAVFSEGRLFPRRMRLTWLRSSLILARFDRSATRSSSSYPFSSIHCAKSAIWPNVHEVHN